MTATSLAHTAYSAAAIPVRTDRGTEYTIFQKTTSKLAKAAKPGASMALRAEALHDNRRLWTALAVDLASENNQLPQSLRAQLFYLAEFSLLQSERALKDPDLLPGLIDVNRSVMRGLDGSLEAA